MVAKRYITTTLPYVNAAPHLGFAGELVTADILARYWALQGDEVFFNTGTDEHGQKILEAATKAGQGVKEYVDHFAGEFKKLDQALGLLPTLNFIRTTAPGHEAAAQELWRRCAAAGDIYLKEYVGLYCVGCEAYKTARELDAKGECLLHPGRPLVKLEEKNYFFKFSKYQNQLLEYLAKPGVIKPEWRREEALNFVKAGLEDFSISRERAKLAWGVPVPGDDGQVMYVWFDALTSYISCLGWPAAGKFEEFWEQGETTQLAGKDQVRFQSLIWQAMLMSAKLKNTDQIIYHGFITSGGQKMSKSLGNVINPLDLVEEYGTDAVRYFLARHVHPFEDSDVTLEKFKEAYNANLANGLGNLVSRVMKLAETHLDEPLNVDGSGYHFGGYIKEQIEKYRLDLAMDYIWAKISELDREIQEKRPWESKDKEIIKNLVLRVYQIGRMLESFMHTTSEAIVESTRKNKMPKSLFPRKD